MLARTLTHVYAFTQGHMHAYIIEKFRAKSEILRNLVELCE